MAYVVVCCIFVVHSDCIQSSSDILGSVLWHQCDVRALVVLSPVQRLLAAVDIHIGYLVHLVLRVAAHFCLRFPDGRDCL